ncbi:hypothetical protein Trydic_g9823 [Trypoxylus dichotomus]
MSEDGNIEHHITELTNLFQKLTDLGEKQLSESWSVVMVLSGLPRSYDTLVTVLETRPETNFTLSLVQSKLVGEYQRCKEANCSAPNSNEALLKVRDKKLTCFLCKKTNHLKKDCRKYKLWKENKNSNTSKENANKDVNDIYLNIANGEKVQMKGKDVLYAPQIEGNLISVKKLVNKGFSAIFNDNLCKWVYKIKTDGKGKVRFKARLVAQGYEANNISSVVSSTFTSKSYYSTLSSIFTISSDARNAFLNGKLSEVVYTKQPPGFEEEGETGMVCLLKRSLYSLKQAAKSWNESSHTTLSVCSSNKEDWNQLKRILKYLKVNGGVVNWACRKQSCVALSSMEAEFIALSEACKEALDCWKISIKRLRVQQQFMKTTKAVYGSLKMRSCPAAPNILTPDTTL